MKKNINKIYSFFFLLLLVSCAENEVVETNETEESNVGPFYAEFLACTAGPDFSQENVASMVASFNELNISESVWWVGGYVPIQGQNKYAGINGWWEIDWESKEAAEVAWKEWAADEDAMAWDESTNSIIDCDTSNILPWNYYTPGASTMEADDWLSFTTSTFECNFNDGKTTDDLRANVQEFNKWVEENPSPGAYTYAIYLPDYDAEQDFLWLNWHGDMATKVAGDKSWAETGQSIQAKFDETATCTGPDVYNSGQIYAPQSS